MAFLGLFGGGNKADATISVNAKTDNAEKNLKMLKGTIGTIVSTYALKQIYDFTKALVKAGDEDKRMAKSFETMTQKINVSADKMLSDMNRVTHRVVQDANLQALAVKAIAQGFSKNEIVAMMELASNFALSTGDDVEQAIAQMFEAGPRSAAMAMKRMGVDIEMVNGKIKLDLDEIKTKAKQLGDAVGNDEDSPVVMAMQLSKNIEEAKGKMGQLIGPAVIAGLKELNFWMGAALGEESAIGSKRLDKAKQNVDNILSGIVDNSKKKVDLIDKIISENAGKKKMPGSKGLGDYWLDVGGKDYEKAKEWLLKEREALVAKIDKFQPAPIDPTGTTKPDGDGNDKIKKTGIDPEAAKAAADAAKKLATDAATAAEDARTFVMRQSLDGRLQLITEQEGKEFQLQYDAKENNEQVYENIRKKYGEMRMQEVQAEQDELNKIIDEEGERQLDAFEERQDRKKESEEKDRQDRLERMRQEAEDTKEIQESTYSALSDFSDAFASFEIAGLKESATSQEEYDKRLAEIQRRAANRQYALSLVMKGIALANAIIDAAEASTDAAASTPGGVATKILSAVAVGAQMAAIVGTIVATNVPAPKFRSGRLGRQNRGGYGDIESAMIDPAETIIPPAQSAMHRDELRAIMNNTANTATGIKSIRGATTINMFGVSTEQVIQAQTAVSRRNAVGRRL